MTSVAVPRVATPLRNVTAPVGIVPPEIRVAVSVSGVPYAIDGSEDRVSEGVARGVARLMGVEILGNCEVFPE